MCLHASVPQQLRHFVCNFGGSTGQNPVQFIETPMPLGTLGHALHLTIYHPPSLFDMRYDVLIPALALQVATFTAVGSMQFD